jgi:hypothetical protein
MMSKLFKLWIALSFTWAIAVAGFLFFAVGGVPGLRDLTHPAIFVPINQSAKRPTADQFMSDAEFTGKTPPKSASDELLDLLAASPAAPARQSGISFDDFFGVSAKGAPLILAPLMPFVKLGAIVWSIPSILVLAVGFVFRWALR